MTPEIHQKYAKLKMASDMMIPCLEVFKMLDLDDFSDKARPFANGTMSIIAIHDMGMRDVQTSEKNLSHAIEVFETIQKLTNLLIREQS